VEENKVNWISEYHRMRNYVKNKELDYSEWVEKFRIEQMNYFKEVEKRLKLIRTVCNSDDDFCNRVHMNGCDGQEICFFDGKIMFIGKQFFVGVGYYWNVNDFDKLVHIEK
jgi:hypothetical protein